MGEASGVLLRSFSQPSPTSCENKEGDPLRALTTSISFGRFMSEPLAWEKWSTFTHNRNLEEVKKFSKPGSVAEKKAYFEAHYKKIAAKKAVALLEQENEAPNHSPEPDGGDEPNCSPELDGGNEILGNSSMDSDMAKSNILLAVDETQGNKAPGPSTKPVSSDYNDRCNINVEEYVLGTAQVERAEGVTEQVVLSENHIQVDFSNQLENVEKHSKNMSIQTEQIPIKDATNHGDKVLSSRKKSVISSSKSLIYNGASKKEENATSNSWKNARDLMERKGSTPQSLHMSINVASPAGESGKMSSLFCHKIGNSRIAKAFEKTTKDRSAQQALTRVSVNGVSKHSLVLPQPENRRSRTVLDRSVLGSRTIIGKSQSLSMNHSESLSACAKKPRSPTVSSSFRFRSEERVAKRKEKLEEKLNSKEAEKVQFQAKSKEKAANDLKKVLQSNGLKSKPSTSFHREIKSPSNNMKKIPPTRPCSPKLGRKPTPSTIQDTCYRPPWRSSPKTDHSKNAIEKKRQALTHSLSSLPKKSMCENASPNIQLLV